MANYPASAPSFASKTPGQVIASAHMNAVQDEVVAIGGGLLNGTAPVVSSNITTPHISAGTSTFTGLTVTNEQVTNSTITTLRPVTIDFGSTSAVFTGWATATTGSSGTAGVLPAQPSGYLKCTINGSPFVIPYYNP